MIRSTITTCIRDKGFLLSALVLSILLLQGCAGTPAHNRAADKGALHDAREAYFKGDYAAARKLLLPLAKAGNAQAQYIVGYMYFYGQGGSHQAATARQWLMRSAANGYPKARIALNRIKMAGNLHKHQSAGDAQPPQPSQSAPASSPDAR